MIGLLFCMSYNSAKNVSFILSVHKRPCLPAPFFAKNKNFNFLMERLRDMPLWQSRETPTFRPFFFFTIFAGGKWSYFYHWLPFLNSGKQRSHFCCWKVSRIWCYCYCCSPFPYSMAMQGWMVILWAHYATEPGHYTTIIMGPRRILGIAEESKFRGCFIKTTWERQERRESRNATRFRQAH